jgi:two-component system, OmpR family, sensor histidine kinase BaeS
MTDDPGAPGYTATGHSTTGDTAAGESRPDHGAADHGAPDHGAPDDYDALSEPEPRGDSLSMHLALGFLGVALAAVALLTGLTVAFAAADVSNLVTEQRMDLTAAIAAASGAGWERHNSWEGADLSPALDLASRTGADAEILDNFGSRVAASSDFYNERGMPQFSAPVAVLGQRRGTAIVRFSGSGLGTADHALRTALVRAVAAAAGLAALLALLAGFAVARRVTRPVGQIISVLRARGRGERSARVGPVRGPSELREMAAALDQMAVQLDSHERVRRDLVADVAHELRTPVAILQAGHEALLDGVVEPTPEQLGSLRDEVFRLARMVDDLQTLAAADAASLHLVKRRCDLAGIAATAADSLAGRFAAAGIALEQHLEPAEILADPRWLHHVITNLLTNALKFSPSGGSVRIDSGASGAEAVLHVTDTGIGIPAPELPRIFDRFWRGRQAAQTSGSGIGLAVAAELAQAHGGSLSAESESGVGTRMTLRLPRAGPA